MKIVSNVKPTLGISVGISSARMVSNTTSRLRQRDADLLITFELGDSVPSEEVFHRKSRLDLELGPAKKEAAVIVLSG